MKWGTTTILAGEEQSPTPYLFGSEREEEKMWQRRFQDASFQTRILGERLQGIRRLLLEKHRTDSIPGFRQRCYGGVVSL
jgi:hypothetical protein